jgi:NAD(P)-dependent dehydrogenase (short-subunit alcohol dehydrogenase family)
LVTGAARRIGRSIALALAKRGVNIAFSYRSSREAASTTARELEACGVQVEAIQADLSDLSECDALIDRAMTRFGSVDVLINNASEFPRTPVEELAADKRRFEEVFEKLVRLHMRAPLYLGLQLGWRMKQQGWGRIVNLTDRVVPRSQAYRNWIVYLVSKYGLHGVTQTLAEELRPEVTVNSIAPGLVIPPPEFTPEMVRRLTEKIPLKRLAGPEEIAADVVHLVQSENKTGSVILTDGGAGTHTY